MGLHLAQIVDSELIGASVGALAAYRRAGKDVHRNPWLGPLLMTLDVFLRIGTLLDVARSLSDMDASVIDAGWKRCGEVRLPQNAAEVGSFLITFWARVSTQVKPRATASVLRI